MRNAIGFAMPAAPIDRNDFRSLKGVLLAVFASFVLSACGGGAATTENQQSGGGGTGTTTPPYTGPVARDADVLKFQQEFWSKTRTTDRCGSCHNEVVGRVPMFVRNDDVNMAYDTTLPIVDVDQPSASFIVEQVYNLGAGHNCWVADPGVCSSIMTTWIENWVGDTAGGGRTINLVPPVSRDPGASKNFPPTAGTVGTNGTSFENTVYPILTAFCSNCHSSEAGTPQQPYFADPDVASAYEAAKPKMNLDTPENSRFVLRLRNEFHNCWTTDCSDDSDDMEAAIALFSAGIDLTLVDPDLVTSKEVNLLGDGVVASGGNRYEDVQIALWEFKSGFGSVAFDTSGVDPAVDLNMSTEVTWYGGWGITTNGGRAQGTTTASRKLYDVLQDSGEFSIEAWVVPANVTQQEARIVSYSQNTLSRNFTLQQNLYNYDFKLRTNAVDAQGNPLTTLNGDPALSTPDADEVLQATLQHVVATYHPTDGRRIYVNGILSTAVDPIPGGTFIDWQDNFPLIIGSEAGGAGGFEGTIRLAAIHRRALTQEQVSQNFDVGVGEKFYLLFNISEVIEAVNPDSSYILFEVAQYDTYAYLFDKPHFITLDGSAPEGIPIEGVRVAMNGLEGPVGQTYATMDDTLSAALFVELGQPLSSLGAVLPLEKGPADDEFFLTFDRLHLSSFDRQPDPTLVITENPVPVADRSSDIGIKTFDEIDATYAAVTGVDRMDFPLVDMTFQELRQSLPAIEDISTFLSSHQVAIAQFAISYCDAMIGGDGIGANPPPNPDATLKFPGFDFGAAPGTSFAVGNRDLFVNPLIDDIMGTGLLSQPVVGDVYDELASFTASGDRPDNLVQRLVDGGSDTRSIAKGVCAAMLGSATTLIQ